MENLVQFTVCKGFGNADDFTDSQDPSTFYANETIRQFTFAMSNKMLGSLPFTLFSSFLCVSLTYRTFHSCLDLMFRWRRNSIKKDDRSFCGKLLSFVDQHELIYAPYDLEYVKDLLKARTGSKRLVICFY